ncbi:alpha/beta hydrolase [Chromatium okenii]|uniref:alpha/beta fold hydrolase n=1 Tax=Chromatium okenii TaxID=61644 RepID=UPI0019032293|nr:alpha/beta hydrolase [Chromatium okenii]MBK1642926.1 alpha/beta hydrolase [Chromatium okenii]
MPSSTATATSHFLDTNGFRVHYQRFGSEPTLIVLLHGSFLSVRSWRHVTAELAQHATVVAIDRPLCGKTSRPVPKTGGAALYSAEAQSDLVAAMIEQLGFTRAIVIGHSTGGTVSLLTALRQPERVQALVLVGAMVYSAYATSKLPAPMLKMMTAAKPLFARLMRVMIGVFYTKALRALWHRQELLTEADIAAYRADFMAEAWDRAFLESFLATKPLGLDTQVPGLTLPTLVITGAHDRAVKPEESERLAAAVPNAQLVVIPDCGHIPHEETPAAFLAAVTPFLQQHLQ